MSTTGTASDFQPARTPARVVGMPLVTTACSALSWGSLISAVTAEEMWGTSLPATPARASDSTTTALPWATAGGPASIVAWVVNMAS